MNDLCERLADWSATWNWNRLSEPAREMMRRLFLDTLGCALGARDHPAVHQSAVVARSITGLAVATGLGSGSRLSVLAATLDSGSAIRALDLNDFYWGPGQGGHPSDIFAVAIAVAEETGATVGDMLAAVAAGYEVYTRLGDLMPAGTNAWAWDHTTCCAMSTALICGRLYGLDRTQLAEALAIAAARSPVFSGLRAGRISSAKAAVPALAQMDAFLATQLARAGMTGPREAIEGPRGLLAIVGPGSDIGHLLPSPEDEERVLAITIKRFPSMGTSQASTAAAVELHRRLGGNIAGIDKLTIRLSDAGIVQRQTADVYRRPDRRETADHSFYALFAMALLDGRLEAAQFAADRWKQPDALAVIDRMTLVPDLPGASEGVFSAIATAVLDNGETVVVEMPYAPGHPRNPLDDVATAEKFRSFAEPVLGREGAGCVIDACGPASDGRQVREIVSLLAAAQ